MARVQGNSYLNFNHITYVVYSHFEKSNENLFPSPVKFNQ